MDGRWRALWVLSAARVAMGFQFQAVGSTAPLLREAFGLSLADIGWLVGLYLLPGMLVALPGGVLSARLGDRRVAIAGTAGMVAGGAICALATGPGALEVGRLVGGAGGVLFNVTASKMVADWFAGREIQLAMAIFVSTWPLGIGIGLLALGALAAATSASMAFAATAAFAAASLALVLALYRPAPDAAPPGPLRWSALAPGDGTRLALAASAWTTYNVGFAVLVAFLPTLLAARGLGVADAGALSATLTAAAIVSVPLGGWLIARHGRPLGFSAVGALGAVVSLGAVYAGSEPAIWLLLGGLLWGAPAGPLSAAPAQFLSPGARAIGLGLFYTMFYVGMAVLPRATGALADATGSPDTVLLVAIGMTLASLALMVATQAAIAGRKAPQRPATRP